MLSVCVCVGGRLVDVVCFRAFCVYVLSIERIFVVDGGNSVAVGR